MTSGRLVENLEFVQKMNKKLVQSSNFYQVRFLVELIYNVINNPDIFMTPEDKNILLQQKDLLMLISKTRQDEEARLLVKHLSKITLSTLRNIIYENIFQ